jgi:hypothetical protein
VGGKVALWRQDALRRICLQGTWTEQDLSEILDLAKQHHGIPSVLQPPPRPIRFGAEHFPAEAIQGHTVTLRALHSLTNVGKIPSNQIIEFQSHGLTIVYSGNSAGKSGYARVLKQACRASSPGAVYADAYAPASRTEVKSAWHHGPWP